MRIMILYDFCIGVAVKKAAEAFGHIFKIKRPLLIETIDNILYEDTGPNFDNRSWAFCKEQREVFQKQSKFKNYYFHSIPKIKQSILYHNLKSSKSGYRGLKMLKRLNKN